MTLEELKKKARTIYLENIINRREYNGIRVDLHGTRVIDIRPAGDTNWYQYKTDDIEDQVAATRNGGSLMDIPKSVWEKWLAEPFFKD